MRRRRAAWSDPPSCLSPLRPKGAPSSTTHVRRAMSDIQVEAAGGGTFEAYLALPSGAGPAPGLLLLPPIYGVEPLIRTLADGYAAARPASVRSITCGSSSRQN